MSETKKIKTAAKPADELVEMTDGTETIRCHPDQVDAWKRAGYRLA